HTTVTDSSRARHETGPRGTRRRGSRERREGLLGGDLGALEMLVRRAVVAFRERRALARLPFPRRRTAARDTAVERTGLDLLLDERDRGGDAFLNRPGDFRLRRDREVATDVLEQRAVGLREVERIACEPLHRLLALLEH